MSGLERRTVMARLGAGPVEYRLDGYGEAAVVVFHGGHLRAGLPLGAAEDVFTALGYRLLAPSRPGYGRTPLQTGRAPNPSGFADVTAELCRHLGIDQVAAVVGISGGGPTAIAMAARHPELAQRLILESAVGFLPWPNTGRTGRVVVTIPFAAGIERVTWGAVRALLRFAPKIGLRVLLGGLSTKPAGEVVAGLSAEQQATVVALLSRMRSGRGFTNDLRELRRRPDVTPEVAQPTLVIASRQDGAVPFAHAQSLLAGIEGAELVVSQSDGHMIWFASDYPVIADKIRSFLRSGVGSPHPAPP
jgi:pimeloyl-ACP methyl ester carboxylesterase